MLINPAIYPTLVLAALLFWAGVSLSGRIGLRTSRALWLFAAVVMALPCILCDLFYTHLFDNWMWFYRVRTLPFSEVSIAGIGLIAGMLYRWMTPETLAERIVIPVIAFALIGIPFSKTVLAPVDLNQLRSTCQTEVCLQSTISTCGPSSAATILKLYGTQASERELAAEAFTYRGGTEGWYLARALHRRGFDVDFAFQRPEWADIPAPSIAGVVLPGGAGHFVAVISSTPERVVIGDPLSGKFEIERKQLSKRYHFTGFFLRVRPRT